ncbi:MAG: DNA repair protein RadA [Bdellovibrionales bacterium]|nr:DNA repair protein RadA [Bdellovibrionales bacterium]
MAKIKTSFVCQSCGAKRAKWEGRCSDCGEWNTYVEEKTGPERTAWVKRGESSARPLGNMDVFNLIDTPSLDSGQRLSSGIGEVDRVLGGGLVKGSYILLGGDPGIGKSTLIMQVAGAVARRGGSVLYISAEESVQQTALRARRLGLKNERVDLASESSLDAILDTALDRNPEILIVDSIQTVFTSEVESAPGSVSQVRECAARLMTLAKTKNITVILIGHVTKDGNLAGPRVLEHMVDTVLAFEGDQHQQFRLLRALKNRFGATNELGVFQMSGDGLNEVTNPSEFFLEERRENRYGSSVFAAMEGSRPVLCEIQALTTASPLPSPRRNSLGIDVNRVHMLAAVLEKHMSLSFSNRDIYANVVGGLRLSEPAVDLALVAALLSSERQIPLPASSCFFGEVGLTGEVRGASLAIERVKEAIKLGFKHIYLPLSNEKYAKSEFRDAGVEFHFVREVSDLENRLGGEPRMKKATVKRDNGSELDF